MEKPSDLVCPGVYTIYHTPGIDSEYSVNPSNNLVDLLTVPPSELHGSATDAQQPFPFSSSCQEAFGSQDDAIANDIKSEKVKNMMDLRPLVTSKFGMAGRSRLKSMLFSTMTSVPIENIGKGCSSKCCCERITHIVSKDEATKTS